MLELLNNNNKEKLHEKLIEMHRKALRHKSVTYLDMQCICENLKYQKNDISHRWNFLSYTLIISSFIAVAAISTLYFIDEESQLYAVIWESRCALENNFLVMEASRPETDCSICVNVTAPVIINADTITKEIFEKLAYASRPVLVRGATVNWTAMHVFGFNFFRYLYENTQGAYESVVEECQFFPFNTDFTSLKQVFQMSEKRANFEADEKPWYIGWSNCHPKIAAILRTHYKRPDFLPDHADNSAIDWIFIGGVGPGASMHLDYVSRPSWQAQVSGSKTWQLIPPPECENVCTGFSITVHTGDIVLIDTNQWYHNTRVNPGPISITIGSEYG